jgi:hypothetical protein
MHAPQCGGVVEPGGKCSVNTLPGHRFIWSHIPEEGEGVIDESLFVAPMGTSDLSVTWRGNGSYSIQPFADHPN